MNDGRLCGNGTKARFNPTADYQVTCATLPMYWPPWVCADVGTDACRGTARPFLPGDRVVPYQYGNRSYEVVAVNATIAHRYLSTGERYLRHHDYVVMTHFGILGVEQLEVKVG